MSIPQIKKTTDYSIFKSVSFNREKNKNHINSIKKIIQEENLLHLHPILVNEDMEVIDGQHRLEAAKELGIEIFYIQDKISYNHILNSNLFQKKMALQDVIKFYSMKDGISDYIEFYEYSNLLNLSAKSLIALMFGSVSRNVLNFIKSGKFKMPSSKEFIEKTTSTLYEVNAFCEDKRITPISMIKSCNFCIAFRNLMLIDQFDKQIFFSKLSNRWFEIKPQISSKEWTRQLLSIYNWKNQNPINSYE